jgi:xylobiose transport system permease protein
MVPQRLPRRSSPGAAEAGAGLGGLGAWNQFRFRLILTQDPPTRVPSRSPTSREQELRSDVPGTTTAVSRTALPVFAPGPAARRWLIAGLAGAGSK